MILIFIGSSDLLAGEHTSRVIEPLLRWLFKGISDGRVEEIHHLIRKAGHVCEYALLALLFCWAMRPWAHAATAGPWRGRRDLLLALVLAAAYAASDEYHQTFVPSRGASVRDVLIDTCGAAAALSLVFFWRKSRERGPTPPG